MQANELRHCKVTYIPHVIPCSMNTITSKVYQTFIPYGFNNQVETMTIKCVAGKFCNE